MNDRRGRLTRRELLRGGSGLAVTGLLGGRQAVAAAADASPAAAPRSRVVLVRRPDVVPDGRRIDDAVLTEMLDEALVALFEEESIDTVWRRLFGPGDVVGIKTNVWRRLPTPPALEEAIRLGAIGAGVEAQEIAVDDRGVRNNPVFQRATALVNLRPMRTHHWSGLGTCLKNVITFVPRPADYHGDTCATLGAMWQLPEIAGKVRLNILVMLTPQFHGVGPHSFSPQFTWPYGGLLVGTDPVGVDATGARIIEAKRREYFDEDRPVSPPPHHILYADTRYGLGASDPERIDLVRVGWQEEALI